MLNDATKLSDPITFIGWVQSGLTLAYYDRSILRCSCILQSSTLSILRYKNFDINCPYADSAIFAQPICKVSSAKIYIF